MAATRVIDIRTEIPGPRSRELRAREDRAVAHPLIVHLPVFAAAARDATITDVDGNTFVDFAGGIGVMNVGHAHPRVVEAIAEQAARFTHTDFTLVPYEGYVALAERLGALVPITGETRAAFFNSGAEAVENAVKIARLATGRSAVIAFEGGFHGRTLMAMTMTSKVHPYKTGLGPFAPEVYRAPFPNVYRGPSVAEALAQIEHMLHTHVSPEHVAAIVFEPQLGEGGFVPADPAFVRGLRALCDDHGIVLVADEVQTGFGRTGRMFAMEHFDVEADLIIGRQVDRRGDAALGRRRSGVRDGRAAPGRDRRHVHRQPARPRRSARRARRVRGGGACVERAGVVGERIRSTTARLAGAPSRGSATCAGSARCSRSSSSATR